MTRIDRPRTGRTTYHRDGTVTTWDCLQEQWVRGGSPSDELLATMAPVERERIMRHCAAQGKHGEW
jgi:hypothetical protein